MAKYALIVAMLGLMAAPLAALKLHLRGERKPFEAQLVRLVDDQGTYKRSRKEITRSLDDFEPDSAFLFQRHFTPRTARAQLNLARFALHRELFARTRETVEQAMKLDRNLAQEAARIRTLADMLEAEWMYEAAETAIDNEEVEKARTLLQSLRERFPDAPATTKASVLLGTLEQVELEILARKLEAEARKAQASADEEERKKRGPVDDWLANYEKQLEADRKRLDESIATCETGRIDKGLQVMDKVATATLKLRKSIKDNRKLIKFRDQPETADRIHGIAETLLVDTYERWCHYLHINGHYRMANVVCRRGLALAPGDRRLLQLKVDIDEIYDPTKEE